MKTILYLLCFAILFSCSTDKKNKPVENASLLTEGIPLKMAEYRKQQISNVIYNLDFDIPLKKEDLIQSKLTLNLKIHDLSRPLYLDFNEKKTHLKEVKVNNKNVEINHQKQHLIIAPEDLKLGKNSVDIKFLAGELSLNRNTDFLYTLLVPDRASTLFPCFDQPNIKAKYQLTIKAPKHWKVVCGSPEENQETKGDFTTHRFGKTDLMSTYLFSFVAGDFSKVTKNPGEFDMDLLYRENNEEKITESIDEIFKIHQQSIDFLEDYTQYNFPFQKLDFITIPPFQYGGMEHVGAVQYRESSLFLDKKATENHKLSRAKLIAHETAHMWFGDLVTMKWFNDVWTKEVFANFMADKIMNPVFPDINHKLSFMMSHYPSAYSEDRTLGTNPIRQSLSNLKNAGGLYGRIIYNKAPIMIRQLEHLIGETNFKKGMQSYIKTFANTNADWNDLVSIFDELSTKDVKAWSKVWVNSSGRPLFSDKISYKDGKIETFELSQKSEDDSNNIWPQSFSIGLVYDNSVKTINVVSKESNQLLPEMVGLEKPNQIIYNYNGLGYGVFPLNSKSISYINDDVARGYTYINLYENFLNHKIETTDALNLFLEGVITEGNERIFSYLTGRISTIYWTFLTATHRKNIQENLEQRLFQKLNSKLPANLKKALFGLYQSIANSPKGLSNLFAIWNKTKSIDSLYLNENDYTNLAMQLAIFGHSESETILTKQQERISNPDRLARFKWLLPSLSNESNERDAFMESLTQAEQREKESWVQRALLNMHHPLRQNTSEKHLKLVLNLLEETQLTGDIFFPKRWLNSSIRRYSSQTAFETLQEFLKGNPNYNPILKNKLLQATDNLHRAQKIKHNVK